MNITIELDQARNLVVLIDGQKVCVVDVTSQPTQSPVLDFCRPASRDEITAVFAALDSFTV